jgi:zinc protease
MPPPAPTSALPRTPAYFSGEANAVALDAVVPRSFAAGLYTAVLRRRLYTALRRERGLSYQAVATYEPRDATHGRSPPSLTPCPIG